MLGNSEVLRQFGFGSTRPEGANTIAGKYLQEMKGLKQALESCEKPRHYIRCVKTNKKKLPFKDPGSFDDELVRR